MFKQAWNAVSKLYDQAPVVDHDDEAGKLLAEIVAASGWWSLAQRVQRDTLGIREMLVHVRAVDGRPVYRPVYPHTVVARPDPDAPSQPIEVWEARPFELRDGRTEWCWDHWSADPAGPVRDIIDAQGDDATERVGETRLAGPTYPRYAAEAGGRPILPYVLYHAAETPHLWDAGEALELLEGTLNVATYYSLFGHVLRSAAWSQRYAVNARLGGTAVSGDDGSERRSVAADPATVLLLHPVDDGAAVEVGQWDPPTDPMAMVQAVQTYETRTLTAATGGAAETAKMSGDPRSGYAISVSRDTQRAVQRRLEPVFRRSDLQLLSVTAALLGAPYPQSGYRVAYRGIPLSGDEREADRTHVLELVGAGILSRVTAYRHLHPGATEAEAEAEIEAAAPTVAVEPADGTPAVEGAPGGAEALQDTALNGAQVDALVELVKSVARKELPRDAAIAIIARSFAVGADQAADLLGSAGAGFDIAPKPTPAPFGARPPGPPEPPEPDDDEEVE